ncbi:MAG TPA: magnesium transporter [Thermomicrobiales bacterium]|nr:magnesium transporter [Thermomicrobiales bacterium]
MATDELVSAIKNALAAGDRDRVLSLVNQSDPSQWPSVMPQLDELELQLLVRFLPEDALSELLSEIEPIEAAHILRSLSHPQAADLLEAMAPDDATDVIDELPEDQAEQILIQMEPAGAAEIRELLAFPADSAGGIMTPGFVAISPNLRASQAIAALQRVSEEAETMYYVYVVDDLERLLGVLSLHRLVLTRPDTPVRELMVTDPVRIDASADREAAARLLVDRNLLALPVVDAGNRLLGIITQDDVADVLEEEATEDIERLGGSQPLDVPYRYAGVTLLFRRRIFWLLLLFAAEAYTGTVMRHFEGELAQVVALSFFVPLLIGTGGNIGSQVTTTLVRAIAVGEVTLRDVRWVLAKEIAVGFVLGLVMAVFAYGRSQLLHVGHDVGFVIALTIFAICVWSAAVAAILPLIINRLRIDPAVVSAPLITTLVDGTGLVIYFSIAKRLLHL